MKKKALLITAMLAAGIIACCGKTEGQPAAGKPGTEQGPEESGQAKDSQKEQAPDNQGQVKDSQNGQAPDNQVQAEDSQNGRAPDNQTQAGQSLKEGSQEQKRAEHGEPQAGRAESGQDQVSAFSKEFSFADVADREFYFSSGAGGWYTVLYIHKDGTFDGHYQDSDMGETEAEYPNGTIYYSDFSGSFTEPEKVNDTTYVFQIRSIEYPCGFDDEIKDNTLYHYTSAYGLDGAEELYLYLPGSRLEELPEAYRGWVGYYDLDSVSETELPFYGLYNAKEENGFSSYIADTSSDQIEAELSRTEEEVAVLEQKLQNAQTQLELNEISGEIYKAWDEALNAVWKILKETLDEESMKKLTEEERAWIAEKEAAVQEAGRGCEGGTMQALIMNQRAAELTRERVYELSKRLK